MREVLAHRVYTGHAGDARDLRTLMSAEFAAVVDVAMEEPPATLSRELIYCRIPLIDGGDNDGRLLDFAIDTVVELIHSKLKVLIACSGGMSRSPLITAAALARTQGTSFSEALHVVTSTGPCDFSPILFKEIQDRARATAGEA
ncbi:protein-tyrosine phosphatase family protein [Rubinisphaera margarita]|uniref:protein-tyrosine phosphatase family protein n=1 Tax=Rubinisphaera margarita TaxID=2909586 RepID=UPI001EE8D9E0|nr:dual specificity protein phosphatase [Rubinisphaera margarita]MCG6157430.1 dual specificity protein phosphatase family protein [Rubinisphaera margarita]